MPIDILMPQLSPTMTEGRLAKWNVKVGDKISAGDIIAEVETDKATMEVETADDGILHAILQDAGTDISVGAPIGILAVGGEKVAKDYKPTSQATAPEKAEEAPTTTATPAPATPSTTAPMPAAPQPTLAPKPAAPIATVAPTTPSGHVKASPLARKTAAQKGAVLNAIQGTGPNGRITKSDVENAPTGGALGHRTPTRYGDEAIKNAPMRKAIASRLTAAKQHVPHFYLVADVQMDALMETRKQLNAHGNGSYKITVNDFIVKACANALRANPAANAAWSDDATINFGNVDISIAVAIEGGLITPILTSADQKGLVQISGEVKGLAAAAKAGALKPEQYEGGSFSISNLGMYGVKQFSAIVNPPQGAILAVGGAQKRPVVNANGQLEVASVMTITLSVDHRVIDGALGAELLASIKEGLEAPATLLI